MILDRLQEISQATDLRSYMEGVLWADENPQTGYKEAVDKCVSFLNQHSYNSNEICRLLREVEELIK